MAKPKLNGNCLALDGSTNPDPGAVKSAPEGSQSQPGPMRQQKFDTDSTQTHFLKLPARVLPAVLPAIVLVCFVCVAFRTVHGQAPQGSQEVEVHQLIEQLAQVDFDQREAAEQQLIEIGSPAVDLLVSTLLDCKPDVCSRVKRILQKVARDCDEESLFKVLAALQIRFEIPDQRIKPLLDRWAIQRRNAVVARWRQQGAVVTDPLGPINPLNDFAFLQQMERQQPRRLEVVVDKADTLKIQASAGSPQPDGPKQAKTQSIAERLQLVLAGSLEQNRTLVLNSEKGAAGFEESVGKLQQQPVSVTIGEDWRGEYSDFDFTQTRLTIPISNLEVQKKTINDSLLAVINKHPLVSLKLKECTVASGIKDKLPVGLGMLVLEGSDNAAEMLALISNDGPALSRVRFVNSKFGKAQAIALSKFRSLVTIDLVRIDLEAGTFEGLALLRRLRRVEIERCKFPASAYLAFQKERRDVRVEFSAKAFLGVSSDSGVAFRRIVEMQPRRINEPQPKVEQHGCVIATVVAGEAADRAGMKAGDVVLSVGDQSVENFEELRIAIAQCEIGEEVAIEIRRDGKEQTLKATMGIPDDLK